MTTIAWDGKVLASDRQVSCNGSRNSLTMVKIQEAADGRIMGVAGEVVACQRALAWRLYEGGPMPDELAGKKASWTLLEIDPDEDILLFTNGGVMQFEPGPTAIGSGEDFAICAMHLGKNAVDAIHVAAHFDSGTDASTIDTLELGAWREQPRRGFFQRIREYFTRD
jgi:ATP-dependent protease HslVU (ClpYQ) peptidase subunit